MIVLNSPHKLLLMIFLLYNNDVTPELMGDLCFDVSLLLYENYVLKEGASGGCPGAGGYCHIWAIWVCAAVMGMVLKQFTLG